MRRAALILSCLVLLPCLAAGQVRQETLDQAAAWKLGQDRAPFRTLAEAVRQAGQDAHTRARIETQLLDLAVQAQTDEARAATVELLVMVASDAAADRLKGWLTDADRTHLARYVLERMTDSDAAGAALLEAMGKTEGPVQRGLIASLGRSGYAPAAGALARLAAAEPADRAAAAIHALGGLATDEAVKHLQTLLSGRRAPLAAEALARCAETRLAAGKVDQASEIYVDLVRRAGADEHIAWIGRLGLAQADPKSSVGEAMDLLTADDPKSRALGRAWLVRIDKPLVDMLVALQLDDEALGESDRLWLLERIGRGGRPEPAANRRTVQALLGQVRKAGPDVSAKALEALGRVGDASMVGPLMALAAQADAPRRKAIVQALAGAPGEKINTALLDLCRTENGPGAVEAKRRAIALLEVRQASEAAEGLASLAGDDQVPALLRTRAVEALAQLGGAGQLPVVLRIAGTEAGDLSRQAAAALPRMALAARDKHSAAQALLQAVRSDQYASLQPTLYLALSRTGTPQALTALTDALKNETTRQMAVSALRYWPSPAAAGPLLQVARNPENQREKILALRGVIQVVQRGRIQRVRRVQILRQVVDLAERDAEKRLAIAAIGRLGRTPAVTALAELLAKTELKQETALATLAAARQTHWHENEAIVRAIQAAIEHLPAGQKDDARGLLKRFGG